MKQKEQLQRDCKSGKLFPIDFVPQPSWSSDEEEALVNFLLLCSSSHFWTSRRTDISLGTNPSLVQYQRGLVCWYCELTALLTAWLTLLSSSITHRFCWVSSFFQHNVCFVQLPRGDWDQEKQPRKRENVFTATYSDTPFSLHVVRTYYVSVLM